MSFDEWFKKKFQDLHESICCGDLVAKNYRKAIKKGYEAGAQSRQAEIDELKRKIAMYEKHVNAIKFIHENQFDENSDTSWILGNLDGFFECLESDLKGKEGQHFDDVMASLENHECNFVYGRVCSCGKIKEEWKPDWSQAPDWATAWSHDRLGSHWWDSAPEKGFDMWIPSNSNSCKYDKSPSFNYQGHWRDSLRKRPK